ncbi:MAG: 23S rRNA (adenine(2503)-C(2))-methyltransferase RlmN [candidate division Zixibacteria bacterium]|nr:23S rRNA (adenine(2503)-C(2))-methyltransferase RlmN [candidate division Zixibacteria bacterium]
MPNEREIEAKLPRGSRSEKDRPNLKGLLLPELERLVTDLGEPKFRAGQLASWMFGKAVTSFDEMTDLSKGFRTALQQKTAITGASLIRESRSHYSPTTKYLLGLEDGQPVEIVLIGGRERNTLCISSQVGCAIGCRFCASGLAGLSRNMTAAEIVDQVIQVRRLAPNRAITNVVIMGMGEPLANYNNVLRAVRILNAPWGLGIGARKITLSTSGIAPKIHQLAREDFQFELSVSLHAADDRTRSAIVPINRRYPLDVLMEACRAYIAATHRIITFEYVLLKGVNDRFEDANRLVTLLRPLKGKVNLIPYNPVEGLPYETPDEGRQAAFLQILHSGGITTTVRRERGRDIDAACGQLRLKEKSR